MEKRTPSLADSGAFESAIPDTESSTAALFRRLEPILRGLSRKIAGERFDLREDLFQEGALGALKAISSFIPSRGNLDHYATRCARGRMLNYRRAHCRWTNEIPVGLLDAADPEEECTPAAHAALALLADRDQGRRAESRVDAMTVWASAATILTAKERAVVQAMFFDGLRANEVARIIGVSAPRITQLYATGVAKLRARFGY